MEVLRIEKKVRMTHLEIIKFQLIMYCHLTNTHLSSNDLSCLTLLGMTGEYTLEDFCELARSNKIFSSNQSARNALAKAEKKDLIIKKGNNKKKISLHPDLGIHSNGNIVIDYKVVYLEQVTKPQLEPQES